MGEPTSRLAAAVAALALSSGALAFGVGPAAAQQLAPAPQKRFIAIGTGGPTGVYFVAGNAICRMVHKEAAEGGTGRRNGLRCSAPSTAGSNYNINEIRAGGLDFGMAQSDAQYYAATGSEGDWKDKPYTDLRAVFSFHAEPIQIIAAQHSGIKGWEDLKGKRVNLGNAGSGQRLTSDFLLGAAGWTKADLALATELNSTEQSKALCDGRIDAYFYTVGVPNAGVSVATDGCGAYIANFAGPLAARLVTPERPYYAWTTIPKGTYKSTVEDVTTWGVLATLVSSSKVEAEVVYEVVRAVFEHIEEVRGLHAAFATLEPKRMVEDGLSAPLHEGALRYYKEKGLR